MSLPRCRTTCWLSRDNKYPTGHTGNRSHEDGRLRYPSQHRLGGRHNQRGPHRRVVTAAAAARDNGTVTELTPMETSRRSSCPPDPASSEGRSARRLAVLVGNVHTATAVTAHRGVLSFLARDLGQRSRRWTIVGSLQSAAPGKRVRRQPQPRRLDHQARPLRRICRARRAAAMSCSCSAAEMTSSFRWDTPARTRRAIGSSRARGGGPRVSWRVADTPTARWTASPCCHSPRTRRVKALAVRVRVTAAAPRLAPPHGGQSSRCGKRHRCGHRQLRGHRYG